MSIRYGWATFVAFQMTRDDGLEVLYIVDANVQLTEGSCGSVLLTIDGYLVGFHRCEDTVTVTATRAVCDGDEGSVTMAVTAW